MSRAHLTPVDVIDAGVSIADREGFDAVSLAGVARRLGVRTPSLYTHVRDLSALRDGISQRALGDLGARIGIAVAGNAGVTALRALAGADRDFAQQAPGRWQSLQRRIGESAASSPEARTVSSLNAAVLRGYAIEGSDAVHAIRLIGSTINGFITLESLGSFDHSSPPPDASWEWVLDTLDGALRSFTLGSAESTPVQDERTR